MKEVFQALFALLCFVIGIGLLLSLAFWAMANIWLLLGILAVIIVLLIIYGMATSDNEWISGITNLTLAAIVFYIIHLVFN